ncbi:hypothetical protein F7R91_05845 [Streptomyces luteolifulvus]|uniref:Uncharacterized protein n=1 Tax=Streptomyces luteolifulvus TaxID=2615112 RepID=A0A6H9V3A0_9ACTN|nr:hypothetical protein F7R91_05845 [Streptomyces luteolifulvus]
MSGGQSWRAHHRTGPKGAVRQVRKMPYDRKDTLWYQSPHIHPERPRRIRRMGGITSTVCLYPAMGGNT